MRGGNRLPQPPGAPPVPADRTPSQRTSSELKRIVSRVRRPGQGHADGRSGGALGVDLDAARVAYQVPPGIVNYPLERPHIAEQPDAHHLTITKRQHGQYDGSRDTGTDRRLLQAQEEEMVT